MLRTFKLKHIVLQVLLLTSSVLTSSAVKKTLFAGDSDIEGWDTDDEFPDSVNEGVGGWTCKQVGKRINKYLKKHQPEWVVLVCGENDLAYGESVDKTFQDFESVVAKIVKKGARVIYMGTKPEPGTKKLHSDYEKYDAKIRAKATGMAATADTIPPLVMVDVYPVFDVIERDEPGELYKGDNLHLSKYGYAYWTEWAKTALADDLGSCIRWENNSCAEQSNMEGLPTSTPTTSSAPTPTPDPPSAVIGDPSVNDCPEGYEKIQSERGCKEAMKLVGKSDWEGDEDTNNWPSRCYFCDNVDDCEDGVWFNKVEDTGTARTGARPICALPNTFCEDDADWTYTKRGRVTDCVWVGKKSKRCTKIGDDGAAAFQACKLSCKGFKTTSTCV
mmetsp:Transcript_8329/g.10467  ORF Transcript_8329/g.10467 Transcript_8329/m.10467 type:complete len:388 (-) Transcript_8329:479-1642(-)